MHWGIIEPLDPSGLWHCGELGFVLEPSTPFLNQGRQDHQIACSMRQGIVFSKALSQHLLIQQSHSFVGKSLWRMTPSCSLIALGKQQVVHYLFPVHYEHFRPFLLPGGHKIEVTVR